MPIEEERPVKNDPLYVLLTWPYNVRVLAKDALLPWVRVRPVTKEIQWVVELPEEELLQARILELAEAVIGELHSGKRMSPFEAEDLADVIIRTGEKYQ